MTLRTPVIAMLFLTLMGCNESGPISESPTPSSTQTVDGLYVLDDECGTDFSDRDKVTFVKDGKLYVAPVEGRTANCFRDVGAAGAVEWGPRGDRD